ncbi:hypothetical protein BH20VER1_BH20VER1_05460 [soil metagenome]
MPIEMLMKTDTLQDSLEKYRQKIGAGGRNRAAAYELALGSGRAYKPGDQISYYIKATPKKVAAYEAAKLASDFDPQNRDENVDNYAGKLGELVKKLVASALAPRSQTRSRRACRFKTPSSSPDARSIRSARVTPKVVAGFEIAVPQVSTVRKFVR